MGSGSPRDRVVVALLAVAAVLLGTNLESGFLWQDEAETALLARHTLQFGYPRATDGRNAIEILTHGYGSGEAWIYSPWLPFYLLAAIFALAGESTWVARLPFAVFGWLSIYLTWRLACRLTTDRRIHRLAVALLVCSVPFLLHMRQCRYYAPTTAFAVGTCLAYLIFLSRPSGQRAALLGLVLVALFHTNFGTFVPALGAVVVHQAMWGAGETRRWLWVPGLLIGALALPWALVFYQPAFVGTFSWARAMDHVEYYVRVTNKYLVPLAFMAAVSAAAWLLRRPRPGLGGPPRSVRAFLILVVIAQASFLLIPDQRHLRYLIPTLPLLAIGEAWWLASWQARQRLIGSVVIVVALFTNALQSSHVRIPLVNFAYELTHRYQGPMEGVVTYLRAHAGPEQVVKIPYDDRTLMFYTTLRLEPPSTFLRESYPDWVIIRRPWVPEEFFRSPYFQRIEARYDRIELDAPDILWQNREDPGTHHFRTVRDAPGVVIYRKRPVRHG